MATQLIQQQNPNYFNSISKGLEAGENMRVNDVKIQAAEQEMAQKQELSALIKLAPENPQAMEMLAMRAPEAAKGLRDSQSYQMEQGSRVLDGFFALPVSEHSQEVYDKLHADFKKTTGHELPAPMNYSEQGLKGLKAFQTRLKGREQELKEQKEFAQIGEAETRTKYVGEQIKTEPFQRANLAASAANTRATTAKTYEDINALRSIRQTAANAGLTPDAFKKQQEMLIEAQTKKQIALPQAQASANQTVQLVKDIVNHPGMSSMVGSRLGFASAKTYLPDWMGGKTPIAGTDASNFMAKFEQLQGKQFLEAFETLKGGGAISEIEGAKATKAISSMQIAQSEKEFKKSANEFIDIVSKAIERQGGVAPQMSPIPSNSSNVINWGDL